MNQNKELKTLRGRKGTLDETSVFDLGLLPPRSSQRPSTAPPKSRPSTASTWTTSTSTSTRRKKPSTPAPYYSSKPKEPEETIWEVASVDSAQLERENELDGKKPPPSRFVYEEYVYGEEGKEPSGAKVSLKEEYEYEKPRKEILRPLTATIRSKYLDYEVDHVATNSSRPQTASSAWTTRSSRGGYRPSSSRRSVAASQRSKSQGPSAVREFEDAIRFEALLDEVEEEIKTTMIEVVEGEHGSEHAMLGDVEINPRFDLRSFLGLKYPLTPDRLKQAPSVPAKRVYTAGVNVLLPPKSYDQHLRYKKHDTENKTLFHKINKVKSSYNRDKLLGDYEKAKASLPEGRFPQPASKQRPKQKSKSKTKSKSGSSSSRAGPSHPFSSFWTRPVTATHIVANYIDLPGGAPATGLTGGVNMTETPETGYRPITAPPIHPHPYDPYYFGISQL